MASAGVFIVVTKDFASIHEYIKPVSLFGCFVAIGLWFYEIYGIEKCANLIHLGSEIETKFGVPGQFNTRPNPVHGFANEVYAAGVIYSAVISAWVYLFSESVMISLVSFIAPFSFVVCDAKWRLEKLYKPLKWPGSEWQDLLKNDVSRKK